MITKLIMWLCHIKYKRYAKRYGYEIFYIKGKGKDYPKYLLYTENERVYKKMDK